MCKWNHESCVYNLVDIHSYLWILDQVRYGKGLSALNPVPIVEVVSFSVSTKMETLKLCISGNRIKLNIFFLTK